MTVAAVVLVASPASALADADGVPSVRRIADVAWSGGAVPIVVVAPDPDGTVAAALAGTPVTLAEPGPVDGGPLGSLLRGIDVAANAVRDTSAALVWPVRVTWVGPETVTSLIEAHGTSRSAVVRPAFHGQAGWPALIPLDHRAALAGLDAGQDPDALIERLAAAGIAVETLELGDPGSVLDRSTARSDLPPYEGPAEPASRHVHEWGAAIAETGDDAPLEGPALAPWGQAASPDPDQPA